MNGMEGVCTKCGAHYYGWAVSSPDKQSCAKCGSALEIRRDGVLIHSVLSPLTVGTAANVVGILR
jgi:NAD-dependent SIR2 family protein deacetylase